MMAADVPTTLSGVLQARLDRLPPPDRRALQLAGVIGPTFWDAALAHLDAAAAARLPALPARALARRLLTEARAATLSTGLFAGAYEHLIRLTQHRVRAASDPHCAHQLLDEAHAALMIEADHLHDAELRQRLLSCITEHRDILAPWTQRQRQLQ